MNIIDAIESNRCIRRKDWPESSWWATNSGGYHVCPAWTLSDLMATDWEVQATEITPKAFWDAYAAARKWVEGRNYAPRDCTAEVVQQIAKALGL